MGGLGRRQRRASRGTIQARKGHDVQSVRSPLYRSARGPLVIEPSSPSRASSASSSPSVRTRVIVGDEDRDPCPTMNLPILLRGVSRASMTAKGSTPRRPTNTSGFVVLNYAALVAACQHLGFSPDIVARERLANRPPPADPRIHVSPGTRTAFRVRPRPSSRSTTSPTKGVFGARDSARGHRPSRFRRTSFTKSSWQRRHRELHADRASCTPRAVTTVSPTYAQEIQTDTHGGSMAPFLRAAKPAR